MKTKYRTRARAGKILFFWKQLFERKFLLLFLIGGMIILDGIALHAAPKTDFLPKKEKTLLNTVDPWGLAFSDQLIRFQSYFKSAPYDFVVGYTHNLVKIWPNKYWFRGGIIRSKAKMKPIYGVTGAHVSFQLAILPKIGREKCKYTIEALSPLKPKIYNEKFVRLEVTPYTAFQSEYWPDPLVLENRCELSEIKCGVFLVEIAIPDNFNKSQFICELIVKNDRKEEVRVEVPVNVVKLKIEKRKFPLVAWFTDKSGGYKLNSEQMKQMCQMAMDNYCFPLLPDYLKSLWDEKNTTKFEKFTQFLIDNGATFIEIRTNAMNDALYKFLKKKKWLPYFYVYSLDEPSAARFKKFSIPYAEKIKKKYPGLKIFVASEYHANMKMGVDLWVTDISSSKYDPRTFNPPEKPKMWHYYCHLPIRFHMRAPLTLAPNMLVDNIALEHRLALWMSWHYKAKGVLIWAGNRRWDTTDENFWKTMKIKYPYAKYPYAGIHNGNGLLVYPPRVKNGAVLPSLRLKILRDGIEDIAIFEAAKKKFGNDCLQWISPVPEVFQHPHYYDHLPETLLKKRETILKRIATMEAKP